MLILLAIIIKKCVLERYFISILKLAIYGTILRRLKKSFHALFRWSLAFWIANCIKSSCMVERRVLQDPDPRKFRFLSSISMKKVFEKILHEKHFWQKVLGRKVLSNDLYNLFLSKFRFFTKLSLFFLSEIRFFANCYYHLLPQLPRYTD